MPTARGKGLAAAFVALALLVTPAARADVLWETDFEAGMARAQTTLRPAFVVFDAPWCSFCVRYRRQSLADPTVRRLLTEGFVAIRVDFDAHPDLAQRFGVRGLPYSLVLESDGRVRHAFAGLLAPVDLATLLLQQGFSRPPAEAAELLRPTGDDRAAWDAFLAAWIDSLDERWQAEEASFSGGGLAALSYKPPTPRTWLLLDALGLCPERSHAARRRVLSTLWDGEGGFFYFLDTNAPAGPHLETSKLLEVNAWLALWLARHAGHEPEAARAARATWRWLERQLWDPREGGFFQAQKAREADRGRYAVDRIKRADTNAQAAFALVLAARALGEPAFHARAVATLNYVITRLERGGRLAHASRGNVPRDLPEDMLWVVAAAQAVGPERLGEPARAGLRAVAARTQTWVARAMARGQPPARAEQAGLVLWLASSRALSLPPGTFSWALGGLVIDPAASPDELSLGLSAWAQHLGLAGAF